MRHRFQCIVTGFSGRAFGQHVLAQIVVVESQPVPPRAARRFWTAIYKGHVLTRRAMRLKLLDEPRPRRWVHRQTHHARRKLIEPVNGLGCEMQERRRQAMTRCRAADRPQPTREEITENAQRRQITVRRGHREQSRTFVDDGQRGVDVEQPEPGMNPPFPF